MYSAWGPRLSAGALRDERAGPGWGQVGQGGAGRSGGEGGVGGASILYIYSI